MKPEEKELVLKDLCARLPYNVKVCDDMKRIYTLTLGTSYLIDLFYSNGDYVDVPIKPYLRPMSSMTEEEYNEMDELVGWSAEMQLRTSGLRLWLNSYESDPTIWMVVILDVIDWLNRKMFDYRGLIEKGLAIEVTENNNPYKD